MPYIWTEPDVFLDLGDGCKIYHIYKNDDMESGDIRSYHFGTTVRCSDYGGGDGGEFDVRDLSQWDGRPIEQVIRAAYEAGDLPEFDKEEDLTDADLED